MSEGDVALEVAGAFEPDRTPVRVDPLGKGHIHSTFLAAYEAPGEDLVLQKLNAEVFADLEAVMRNLVCVTDHLRRHPRGRGPRAVLEVVTARGGASLVHDRFGGVWRALRYLNGTHTLDVAPDEEVARLAAFAFGDFAASLVDLDPASLEIPIPGFHDLPARLDQLRIEEERDRKGRRAAVRAELDAIAQLGEHDAAGEELPEEGVCQGGRGERLLVTWVVVARIDVELARARQD